MKESISELTKVVIVMVAITAIFASYKLLSNQSEKTYLKASCCIMASGNYTNGNCDTKDNGNYNSCVNSINTSKYNTFVESNTTFAAITQQSISKNTLNNSISSNFDSKYRIESTKSSSNTNENVINNINNIESLKNNTSNDTKLVTTYKEINKENDLSTSTVNNTQTWKSESKAFSATTINSNITDKEVTLYYTTDKNNITENATWENSKDIKEYLASTKDKELNNSSLEVLEYNSVLKSLYEAKTIISDIDVNNIYNENNNKIVMLNTFTSDKITGSANGFFIKEGYILTSWSYIKTSLKDGNKIMIKDNNNNSYIMDGLVSVQPSLDIAVVKLTEEIGNPVALGNYKDVSIGDSLITISSISGYKLSLKKGMVINNQYNLKTLIPISKEEQGSPVFNKNGEVVSFNTEESINKSYSISVYTASLNKLISTLNKTLFKNVKTLKFNDLQEKYFHNNQQEKIINLLSSEIWNTYKKIGNIEKNIPLEITKASYANNILSIRYKNDIDGVVDFKELTKDFTDDLKSSGYKNTKSYNNKLIYEKNNKKIIILKEFDYIIVLFIGK